MEANTRVLIADDHALYREGTSELINHWDGFVVVGEAANGEEAIKAYRETKADIVLMDVRMPVMGGLEAARVILSESPNARIVMSSVSFDQSELIEAIRCGVKGYLSKDIHARNLRDSLLDVMSGGTALSSEASASCFDIIRTRCSLFQPSKNEAASILSQHECELVSLLAQGYTNREIGEQMYLGESTVKKRLSAIMLKLGLENRVQMATFALRAGLTD